MNKVIDNYEINIMLSYNLITLKIKDKITYKTCIQSFKKNEINCIPINTDLSLESIYDYCIQTKTENIKQYKINDLFVLSFNNYNFEIIFEINNNNFYDLYEYNLSIKLDQIENSINNIKKYEINLIPNINISHIIFGYIALNSLERILKIIYKN